MTQQPLREQEMLQPSLDVLYQRIWKTKTSLKIQHFLWKCLSNSLPVAGNMAYRHLTKDASCIKCQGIDEDVNHLLFQCSFARLVWAVSPIPAPPNAEMSESLFANFSRVLGHSDEKKPYAEIATWIMWRLWKNRNTYLYNGVEWNAQEVIQKALEDAKEWDKRTEDEDSRTNLTLPQPRTQHWVKPTADWLKVNVDGAWTKHGNKCGIGWVLRDSEGRVKWVGARALPNLRMSLEAELEALRWAVQWSLSFQYDKIIFETDSQQVMQVIHDLEKMSSSVRLYKTSRICSPILPNFRFF